MSFFFFCSFWHWLFCPFAVIYSNRSGPKLIIKASFCRFGCMQRHTNTLRQSLMPECHGTLSLCWATCPCMEIFTGLTFNRKCRASCPVLGGITSLCGCSMCEYNMLLYEINAGQLRHLGGIVGSGACEWPSISLTVLSLLWNIKWSTPYTVATTNNTF